MLRKMLKILRIFRLIVKFLFIRIPHKILFCLTVDFDFFQLNHPENLTAFAWLKKYYCKIGAQGNITYFLSEHFQEVKNYKFIMQDILAKGNRIEMHSHHEKLVFEGNYDELKNVLISEKETLLKECRKIDKDYSLYCYRSGTLSRSATLFRVLNDLNFKYDSSLTHHYKMLIHSYSVNDYDVPLNCYFPDQDNFKKESTAKKGLLEIPIWHPLPDLSLIKSGIRKKEPVIICTLIHPFNILNRGKWNLGWIWLYCISNFFIRRLKNLEYKTIHAAGEIWKSSDSDK